MPDSSAVIIYTDLRHEIVRYADSIVRDTCVAEDLVQEAYLRFQDAMRKGQLENPVGYLYRIVRNLATDHLRVNRRREEIINESGEDIWWLGQIDELDPERRTVATAEGNYLSDAIAQLPQRCRRVLYLRRFRELTLTEIADQLEISVDIVRNDLKRAMKAMTRARRHFQGERP